MIEAALRPSDIVMGAIAGTAGVEPTFAALSAGRTVALANKECLVCAGRAFHAPGGDLRHQTTCLSTVNITRFSRRWAMRTSIRSR